MKFSKKLQRFMDDRYREHYIAYKDLKKAIKLITGADTSSVTIKDVTSNFGDIRALSGSVYRPPEARFQDLLNHELDKINNFARLTFNCIKDSLRIACRDLTEDRTAQELEALRSTLRAKAKELVFLESYQGLNFTGFRKITKKYDKHNHSSSAGWYMARLVREDFLNLDLHEILYLLSEGFLAYRTLTLPPPDRGVSVRTAKYLVSQDDLMRVKTLVVEHVPVEPTTTDKAITRRLSCVYFDSDHLAVCAGLIDQPTHGNAFRLCVDERSGNMSLQYVSACPEQDRSSGVAVTESDLQDLLCSNSSSTAPIATTGGRITVIQAFAKQVAELQVKAAARCWFTRTAFGGEGNVRLTMDESITFVGQIDRERSTTPIRWTKTEVLATEAVENFPWAVLSITTPHDPLPDFLNRVTGSASTTEVYGFSLFVHCLSYLYENRLKQLPHWLPYTKHEILENAEEGRSGGEEGDRVDRSTTKVDVLYTGARSRLVHQQEAAMQEYTSPESHPQSQLNSPADLTSSPRYALRPSLPSPTHLLPSPTYTPPFPPSRNDTSSSAQAQLAPPPRIPEGPVDRHGKDLRELAQPLLAEVAVGGRVEAPRATRGSEAGMGIMGWLWGGGNRVADGVAGGGGGGGGGPDGGGAGRGGRAGGGGGVSVRVEPKTFFANERTLLQWMNTAVLLSTISITLLNFGTKTSRVAGLIMAPVAIFFICYAFWSYLRRSYSLERKEPIDYNDRIGPAVLVVTLVLALTAVIGLNVVYGGDESNHTM
eukprot:GHVS01028936.1.p1 GENE.GHVS01028936.1~~GHVS01028936.1.p1  ORF type:complete len:767 (+),score=94.82 GHVS01028936.1:35-2335(+)